MEGQKHVIDGARGNEETALPADLDYTLLAGLSHEVRQKLAEVRPATLGQAGRIPGVTPAAVSILLVHLNKRGRGGDTRGAWAGLSGRSPGPGKGTNCSRAWGSTRATSRLPRTSARQPHP